MRCCKKRSTAWSDAMSTFAVFGMSENRAREEAKEHTNTYKMENGKMEEQTIPE